MKATTHAFLDAGAVVSAGGNVLVSARDDTDLDLIGGTAAFGSGFLGIGATFVLALIEKDTRAWIGAGATVDAKGQQRRRRSEVSDGSVKPVLGTKDIHGLGVQAASTESVFASRQPVADTSIIAIAGAMTFTVIDSDTAAFIDAGAHHQPRPGRRQPDRRT